MKKNLLSIIFILFFVQAIVAQNNVPKLSPLTKKYLREIKKTNGEQQLIHNYVYKSNGNTNYISSLIKVNNYISDADLNALGVQIGTRAGKIWTAQIPVANVEAFTHISGIDYIQLDEPTFPTLDSARSATHVDSVHAGIGLPMPYNGEGVVVGVVDAGFDFSHPAFFDTTGTGYRVKKVWMQKNNSGTPPNGFAYGTEETDSTALWTIGHDNWGTHATHVAGIAAGSGYGSPNANTRFKGFAYKSDLVFVGITPDKSQWISTGISDMIDGINYIFTYAASVNKPSVVNLSWGSPLGPHDGSGLFSQALDNLTGPGKIFVCAAGNNGQDSIHVQKTFNANDSLVQTILDISDSPEGKKTWVDVWGDSSKIFCVQVSLYNNGVLDSSGFICLDDSVHDIILKGTNGDTCLITMITAAADFNMKPRIFLDFDSKLTTDKIVISVKGFDGTVNFWNSFVSGTYGYYGIFQSYGYPWAVNGDNVSSISDIASTKTAITVAAYVSKNSWINILGQGWGHAVVNKDLAPFSSRGPTTDGRIKPDITGPGMSVGSSISSYDSTFYPSTLGYRNIINSYHNPSNNRDYTYGQLSGTSMASPAVSGITALLLQVKNDLSPQEVKDILNQTAINDAFTGTIPPGGDNTWGGGKVNAYGSVKQLVQMVTGINSVNHGTIDCGLFPNPNHGEFNLNYTGNKSENILITVYDVLGHSVYSEKWRTDSGDNFKQINLKKMNAGIYYTKISSSTGDSIIKMTVEN